VETLKKIHTEINTKALFYLYNRINNDKAN